MISRQIIKGLTAQVIKNSMCLSKVPVCYFSFPPGKKIKDNWDYLPEFHLEMADAIYECHSADMITQLMLDNADEINDNHLAQALNHLWEHDIPLTENFHKQLMPVINQMVRNMDKNHCKALASIIQSLGWMRCHDDEFWTIVETKLFDQKLYKYVPLQELTRVAHALSTVDEGSRDLFEDLEGYFVKHRLNMLPGDVELTKEAFENKKFESRALLEAMDSVDRAAQLEGGAQGHASH